VLLQIHDAGREPHEIAAKVEIRSCRPSGERFLIGATILEIDDDSRMWLMEWCYVVCSHERLRGHRPVGRPPEVEPIVIHLRDEEPALALAG
jgi:hypothetical protein